MQKILIIDYGSQVTQLIARRIRENNVYCEIWPYRKNIEEIKSFKPVGIVLSGGPSSVFEENAPYADKSIFDLGLPILGICYGEQLICHNLGGEVLPSSHREFGRSEISIKSASPLFDGFWNLGENHTVWMSHGDKVSKLPSGFKVLADTPSAPFAAIANEERRIYGVQFHPEVVHTPDGSKLLGNFVKKICGASGDWTMGKFLEEEIEKIRKIVGTDQIIAGVSGGVDSTVVAALLHKAVGNQLHCFFVDHGLLRKNERQYIEELFSDFHIPLQVIDASEKFLTQLKGISDPEQKRKIIGRLFIEEFDIAASKVGNAKFLAQGTLYPDVIESVSVHGDAAVTIKSHHNVGGLPDKMNLKLIEPVRELFKDEVRALGRELGIKEEMIRRHPFPGPGLAIRMPGEITREKLDILRNADAIFIEEIKAAGLYDIIWQAFAVLLPVKTVGVMGDGRTYEHVCGLRAVTSTDGMTADFYPFDGAFLGRVATRIINEVKGVNRVVYDVTSKPPGTIEWE